MPAKSLEVEHLMTMRADTGTPHPVGNGPKGNRLIVPVTAGSFEGPRLRGTVETPGGDWVTLQASGAVRLDVRVQLKTDDGAEILVTYNGIGHAQPDGSLQIRTAPMFETGDERYAWLNDIQAVGVGKTIPGGVEYEVYQLL
jgi:hypothetical protein